MLSALKELFSRVEDRLGTVGLCENTHRGRDLHLHAKYPVNTKRLYNICTMLEQRRRRWADVVQILYKCFVLARLRKPCRRLVNRFYIILIVHVCLLLCHMWACVNCIGILVGLYETLSDELLFEYIIITYFICKTTHWI